MSENRWLFQNRQYVGGRNVRLLGVLSALLIAGACSDGQGTSEPPTIRPSFTEGAPSVNLTTAGSAATINGARLEAFNPATSTGTGVYESFVRLSTNAVSSQGYNTSGRPLQFDENNSAQFTHDLPLNVVPQQPCGFGPPGALCREFNADINQIGGLPSGLIDLLRVRIFVSQTPGINSANPNAPDFGQGAGTSLVWDLDGAGNVEVRFDYNNSTGSGGGDVKLLVPVANFPAAAEAACPYDQGDGGPCGWYIYFYSQWGTTNGAAAGNGETNDGFEEWNTRKAAYVQVTKTAETSLTRTHSWDITKAVDPSILNLFPGQSGDAEYTIEVIYNGFVDSEWAVEGTITVHNPTGEVAEIASVTDIISGGPEGDINVSVSCGVTFPYELDGGDDLVCTYSQALTSGADRTNTARATLVDAGVNTGTADIDFSTATINEIDESATITDTYADAPDFPAGVDAPNEPTFTYTRTFTCDEDEGEHNNIVTITGDDTGTPHSDNASVQVNCGILEVSKNAETSYTRTFEWEIEKSVTPETWDLFTGDQGTSEYTVTVTKTGFTDSDWAVAGTITVHNPEAFAAEIASVADAVSGVGAATVSCGVSFPYSLAAGADLICTYELDLPNADPRTNTATATTTGGGEFTDDADVTFGDPTTLVNDEITVDDTYAGDLGSFNDTGSTSYERTFACDADEGQHDNTATINETGQSDDASVTVNCHDLSVTKDATTSLTRTWTWQINKAIDVDAFEEGTYNELDNEATIQENEPLVVKYNITIDASSVDSEWAVAGDITVTNNNPSLGAEINSVADIVSPDIAGTVDCGVTFPHTIAAGGTLECTYTAGLPDDTDRTNTATATLQNKQFDSQGGATPSGTTDFSGTADVIFPPLDENINEIDECVNVNDVLAGDLATLEDLGTYCADDPLPHTFEVFRTFGPEDIPVQCGDNTFNNVATATANDTGAEVSDDADINIFVNCETGCTLTQGYWKTHNVNFRGGAPPDPTWYEVDFDGDTNFEGPDELFFLSNQTWFQVFWTAPQGNVYYNLAHQYMAARLNVAGGAGTTPEVAAAIASATTLFQTYTPAQIANLKGKPSDKALRDQFIALAGILGSYNEGLIGPGHCTENDLGLFGASS